MSFQAYLDTIEKKTGLTPRQLVDIAHEKGFGADTKATPIVEWLAADYGLGRGHAMALVHVITKGPQISDSTASTSSARPSLRPPGARTFSTATCGPPDGMRLPLGWNALWHADSEGVTATGSLLSRRPAGKERR